MKSQKPYMCPIIIGILLVLIGLIIRVPGGALTTYKSLDGESAGGYYAFDNRYSSIDEYVGGDAYNYIIGTETVDPAGTPKEQDNSAVQEPETEQEPSSELS